MLKRNLAVSLVALLLLGLLAGCASGGVMVPEREVMMSMEEAQMAQEKAMAGLFAGSVEWTESEFSSLVTELIKQNGGAGVPIEGVTAWFSPDTLYLRAHLPGVMTADLAGNIMVENNRLSIELSQAGAMGMAATGPILSVIEGAINRALDDDSLGVAVSVGMGEGTLMVGLQ